MGLLENGDAESDANDAKLNCIAAELREQLTAEDCRRLAEMLTEGHAS